MLYSLILFLQLFFVFGIQAQNAEECVLDVIDNHIRIGEEIHDGADLRQREIRRFITANVPMDTHPSFSPVLAYRYLEPYRSHHREVSPFHSQAQCRLLHLHNDERTWLTAKLEGDQIETVVAEILGKAITTGDPRIADPSRDPQRHRFKEKRSWTLFWGRLLASPIVGAGIGASFGSTSVGAGTGLIAGLLYAIFGSHSHYDPAPGEAIAQWANTVDAALNQRHLRRDTSYALFGFNGDEDTRTYMDLLFLEKDPTVKGAGPSLHVIYRTDPTN